MQKKVITTQFGSLQEGAKEYAYFTVLDLEVGDTVVAETPRHLSIVTVAQVDNISTEAASFASKWIVDKVDIDAHCTALKELGEIS